ncbi:MAG: (5-formylfuran-3-yl)methyl phosphate synthase [Planctomycetaceae bacterium]|nr:(5-formylfuran-3-yl)methyl phosphate synthase [Planctomycetaceae bacterium]
MINLDFVGQLTPQLLVSIRNTQELTAAMDGGADIIDVKEPANGPLGMADPATIESIAKQLTARSPKSVFSVALGELTEWFDRPTRPALPASVRWAKLGFAGCRTIANWEARWNRVQKEFDAARGTPYQWVAVAYADYRNADAPKPMDVLMAAVEHGCAAFLLDTFDKADTALLDWMSPYELPSLLRLAEELQMPVALAGRIEQSDVEWVCDLEPAIVGVRSAVCLDGNRTRTVNAVRVAEFKQALLDQAPKPKASPRLPQSQKLVETTAHS